METSPPTSKFRFNTRTRENSSQWKLEHKIVFKPSVSPTDKYLMNGGTAFDYSSGLLEKKQHSDEIDVPSHVPKTARSEPNGWCLSKGCIR